jgi:hypothetical protein
VKYGAMPGKKKGGKSSKSSAGPKLKGFLGVTKQKSEPDNPIVQPPNMKLGGKSAGNPGSKAREKSARVKRLSGVRL